MTVKRSAPALAAATLLAAGAAVAAPAAQAAPLPLAQAAARASAQVRDLDIGGTAWGVDPASKKLVITADRTVTPAEMGRITALAADTGGAVAVNRTPGAFRRYIAGGDAIWGSGYRCSLGFNVRNSAGTYYFLTAGHCGNVVSKWYTTSSSTTLIGTTQASTFPGHDYSLVKYGSSVAHAGTVDLHNGSSQDITSAANATVGESVKRSGSTTGVHSGTVQALNQTVNYGSDGIVSGLIKTNVCAEPGDSGGALFDGTKALGLTSGGSGDCTSGGTTFFQPVKAALTAYGVSVY